MVGTAEAQQYSCILFPTIACFSKEHSEELHIYFVFRSVSGVLWFL